MTQRELGDPDLAIYVAAFLMRAFLRDRRGGSDAPVEQNKHCLNRLIHCRIAVCQSMSSYHRGSMSKNGRCPIGFSLRAGLTTRCFRRSGAPTRIKFERTCAGRAPRRRLQEGDSGQAGIASGTRRRRTTYQLSYDLILITNIARCMVDQGCRKLRR